MHQVSKDEKDEINDEFLRQKFWWEDVHLQLDSWIAFYFKFGRFPGSQKLISIPNFLRTDMPISPVDLYKNLLELIPKHSPQFMLYLL